MPHRGNVGGWNSIYILNINSVNAIWKRITHIWMFSVPICLFIQRFPIDIFSHCHSPFGGCQFDPVCRTKNKYITWLPYLSDAI